MADRIPFELKMKVVEELHVSNDKLSSISFLWPELIPLIRDYRFKNVRIGAAGPSHIPLSIEKLLLIISGAPEIAEIVRKLSFVPFSYPAKMKSVHFELDTDEFEDNDGSFERRMYYVYSSPNLIHLLSLTTKLESIHCNGLFLTMLPSFHRGRLFAALASLPCVRNFTIHKFLAEKLSHLDDLFHSLPHLTTLAMSSFSVVELHHMFYDGPYDIDHYWTGDDIQLLDWQDPDYETPKVKFGPFENIVSLDLSYETPSGCIFLDMIPVVPLCPFPNLEKLVFNFEYLSERSYYRLRQLLLTFHSSLKHLDIQRVTHSVWPDPEYSDLLVLPRNLQILEFSLSDRNALSDCARWLVDHAHRPGTIPLNTIILTVVLDGLLYNLTRGELAKVLMPMDAALAAPALGVQNLRLKVYHQEASREVFEEVFPCTQERFFTHAMPSERKVVGEIRWCKFHAYNY